MKDFEEFIKEKFGMEVIFGTHPIPQKYLLPHRKMDASKGDFWKSSIQNILADEKTRLNYD